MCTGSSNFTTLIGTDVFHGDRTSDPACDVVHVSEYHVGFFAGTTENLNLTTVYLQNEGGKLVVGSVVWWAVGLVFLTFALL